MNNDETYTPCTQCGRPMAYCKGQCCGKPKGCQCREYGPSVCGAIRQCEPKCPHAAVIPSVVVEHADSLKDLCDTFVHVSDINTTFYIDDKHRPIITWAGPVEYDNYDLATNSLDLRSQFLIDFANNRGAYYNKTGNYQIFNFGESESDEPVYVTLSFPQTTEWVNAGDGGLNIDYDRTTAAGSVINTREVPSVTYRKVGEATDMTAEEVFNLLESGADVVFMNVPLGWRGTGQVATGVSEPNFNTDNLRTNGRKEYLKVVPETDPDSADVVEHSGITYYGGLPLGYGMERYTVGDTVEYKFFTQGIDRFTSPT